MCTLAVMSVFAVQNKLIFFSFSSLCVEHVEGLYIPPPGLPCPITLTYSLACFCLCLACPCRAHVHHYCVMVLSMGGGGKGHLHWSIIIHIIMHCCFQLLLISSAPGGKERSGLGNFQSRHRGKGGGEWVYSKVCVCV